MRHVHIDPNGGQYVAIDSQYSAGYEDGKKEGRARGQEERDALRAEVARQHDEILRLQIYAPGTRGEHQITPAPHIAPTDFAVWGIIDPDQGNES